MINVNVKETKLEDLEKNLNRNWIFLKQHCSKILNTKFDSQTS